MNFTIAERTQREIYLKLLPEEAYQLKFTTDCDKDYTLMTKDEFFNAALCSEKADKVMCKKKEKLHKSNDNRKSDSTSNLSGSNKRRNQSGAKKRTQFETKEKNGKGVALFCAFCHADGAPKWVYTNHTETDCTKKEQHKRKVSGSSSSKHSYQQKAKKEMRAMKKKYLKLKQATKELRMSQKNPKKKSKKVSDYSSDDESIMSEDSELFGDSD